MATAQKKETENAPEITYISDNYASGIAIPWQLKMALKISFAYLPLPYSFWKKIGLFQHGEATKNLKSMQKSFENHLSYYQEEQGKTPETALELGPGDSIGHALSARAIGIKKFYAIDAGDFASRDPAHYKAFMEYLVREKAAVFNDVPKKLDRDATLKICNAEYKTNGVHDMKHIADESLDFSFSHAVFEHIRRDDFQPYMNELYRTHKKGSISRHWVDLHDHLGGALNSMRFSEKFWEGKSVTQAGFYTNRLTMQQMIDCAENAGFEVEIKKIIKWPDMPTPVNDMDKSFHEKSEEELNVCTFLMVMRKS